MRYLHEITLRREESQQSLGGTTGCEGKTGKEGPIDVPRRDLPSPGSDAAWESSR